MAFREIHRRVLSRFALSNPQIPITREYLLIFECEPCSNTKVTSLQKWYSEHRLQVFPAINSLLHQDVLYNRRFGALAESNKVVADSRELEGGNIEPDSNSAKTISSSVKSEDKLKHEVKSSLKISTRHDLAMVFTCKVCETRNMKTASRESYEKGVVVARCGGCNNLHLIADRLGWFGEPGSIEDFLAAQGQEVKRGSPETLNLTLEDLAGRKLGS